jgi:hypothetical protein
VPPSLAASYLRALFDRRPRRLPPASGSVCIEAEAGGVVAEAAGVRAFRDVCELPDDGNLPLTYPHVLAGGVHLAMLQHPDFPVRMVGLVHLTNAIELFRPLRSGVRLALDCRVESGRSKPRGDEFRMVTEGLIDGELAWRETTGFLAPAPQSGRRPAPEVAPTLPPMLGEFTVPAGTGRRYAWVSGDWNPIHLADLLARPFGFPAAIAHGMWMVARCLGWLAPDGVNTPARLDVRFLKPLLLPSQVRVHAGPSPEGHGQAFWLVSAEDGIPHLRGTWRTED